MPGYLTFFCEIARKLLNMTVKLHKKSQAKKFSISGGTQGLIYPNHPQGQHTIALIKMNGKYPVVGYSINQKCSETIIVLAGIFKIRIDNNVYKIKPGDVLIILPKTRYRIEGQGEAIDVITPAWNKRQNKIILDKKFKIKL